MRTATHTQQQTHTIRRALVSIEISARTQSQSRVASVIPCDTDITQRRVCMYIHALVGKRPVSLRLGLMLLFVAVVASQLSQRPIVNFSSIRCIVY